MASRSTRIILSVYVALLFPSCSVGTVKSFLKDREFQAENLPVRTLRTLVLIDGTHDQSKIAKLIDQSSQLVEEQVGIRLEIIDWKSIDWKTKLPPVKMLKTNAKETSSGKDQFDIAIAFTGLSLFGDSVLGVFGGTWLGIIDDTYRRFIIVKLLDPYVLLQELFHAFIFSETHSMICIMTRGFILSERVVSGWVKTIEWRSSGTRTGILMGSRMWREEQILLKSLRIGYPLKVWSSRSMILPRSGEVILGGKGNLFTPFS